MDLVEDNEQNRKDYNNINKIPHYMEQHKLTLISANIYVHPLPECRSTCMRTAAVSTVIKLFQAGLKS